MRVCKNAYKRTVNTLRDDLSDATFHWLRYSNDVIEIELLSHFQAGFWRLSFFLSETNNFKQKHLL